MISISSRRWMATCHGDSCAASPSARWRPDRAQGTAARCWKENRPVFGSAARAAGLQRRYIQYDDSGAARIGTTVTSRAAKRGAFPTCRLAASAHVVLSASIAAIAVTSFAWLREFGLQASVRTSPNPSPKNLFMNFPLFCLGALSAVASHSILRRGRRPDVLWGGTYPPCGPKLQLTSTASCAAKSGPTCRCKRRPRSSLSSTSRPPRRPQYSRNIVGRRR